MTDESPEVERPALAEISGVRYIGTSDERVLARADLAARGIKVKADLIWSAENDHFIPTSHLNAAVVDILAADPAEFVLVEA